MTEYILIGRKIENGNLEVMQCGSLKNLTEYGLNHFVMFTILDASTLKPRYRYIEPSTPAK